MPFRPTERLARSRQRKRVPAKKLAVADVVVTGGELEDDDVDAAVEVSES